MGREDDFEHCMIVGALFVHYLIFFFKNSLKGENSFLGKRVVDGRYQTGMARLF